jgi:hypothetical protein
VTFSPDGRLLASWSSDRSVRLWELSTGKERRLFFIGLSTGTIGYSTLTFSPDGRLLAAGHFDRSVRVWDVLTGREVARCTGLEGWVRGLAFSPDSRLLAGGGDDGVALVWDLNLLRPAHLVAVVLTEPELAEAWDGLAAADSVQAGRSLVLLARSPTQAVALLKEKVRDNDGGKVAKWIAQLDDEDFTVRERASEELEKLGRAAEPALRKVLDAQPLPTAEMRRRVLDLLEKLGKLPTLPDGQRVVRAVEVLERLGTEDARQALTEITKNGGSAAAVAAEAALQRLAKLPPAKP